MMSIGDLFAGFNHRVGALLAIGGLYLAASIAMMLLIMGILWIVLGANMMLLQDMPMDPSANPGQAEAMVLGIVFAIAVTLLVTIPFAMCFWFAPALIVFQEEVGVLESLKLSFLGCLRNILPFFVYGLIVIVLSILAAITFGLGYLVLVPVLLCSMYWSYREIFLGE